MENCGAVKWEAADDDITVKTVTAFSDWTRQLEHFAQPRLLRKREWSLKTKDSSGWL